MATNLDRQDNNIFVSRITQALRDLSVMRMKISPKNLAIKTGFTIKDIEMNLYDIVLIMDSLGIE